MQKHFLLQTLKSQNISENDRIDRIIFFHVIKSKKSRISFINQRLMKTLRFPAQIMNPTIWPLRNNNRKL